MKKVVLFVAVLMFAGAVAVSAQTPEAKLDVALSGNASFTFGINLDASLPQDATNSNGTTKRVIATGISNAFENKATLTILASADYEKGGKEGEEVYGWIKLKNVKISGEIDNDAIGGINNGDDDVTSGLNIAVRNVEAKLFLGPVYVNVLGANNEVDKAGGLTNLFVSDTADIAINPDEEFRGFAIGLKDESVVSLAVGLSSHLDYATTAGTFDGSSAKVIYIGSATEVPGGHYYVNAQTTLTYDAGETAPAGYYYDFYGNVNANSANVFNDYNLYAAFALKAVPDLTLEASVTTGKVTDADAVHSTSTFGLGGKLGYGIALAEGIKLSPYVALDYGVATATLSAFSVDITTTATDMQFAAGINLSVPGSKLDDWDTLGTEVDIDPGLTSILSYDAETITAASSFASVTTNYDPNLDLGIYFYDADLIPVLNLVVAAEFNNILGDVTTGLTTPGTAISYTGFGVYAEAVLDQLKPWAKYYSLSNAAISNVTNNLRTLTSKTVFGIGVDITVITNTTFSISYENSGIANVVSTAVDPTVSNADLGTIKFTTKISY